MYIYIYIYILVASSKLSTLLLLVVTRKLSSLHDIIRRPTVGVSEHLLKGGLPPYPEGHLGRDPKMSFSIEFYSKNFRNVL